MFIVVDCESKRVPGIVSSIEKCGVAVQKIHFKDCSKDNFAAAAGVVISGGPHLFTADNSRLAESFGYIPELKVPTFGICLGHQAIGIAFGAEVYRGEERREQEIIKLDQQHWLFEGLGEEITVGTDHCEGISCPAGFSVIASSEIYPVEAISSQDSKFIGVQFHPEISGRIGTEMFRRFVDFAQAHSPG